MLELELELKQLERRKYLLESYHEEIAEQKEKIKKIAEEGLSEL